MLNAIDAPDLYHDEMVIWMQIIDFINVRYVSLKPTLLYTIRFNTSDDDRGNKGYIIIFRCVTCVRMVKDEG